MWLWKWSTSVTNVSTESHLSWRRERGSQNGIPRRETTIKWAHTTSVSNLSGTDPLSGSQNTRLGLVCWTTMAGQRCHCWLLIINPTRCESHAGASWPLSLCVCVCVLGTLYATPYNQCKSDVNLLFLWAQHSDGFVSSRLSHLHCRLVAHLTTRFFPFNPI